MVEDFVGCDPVYPCVELGVSSERGKCGPDLDEYVLEKVVCVLVTAQESADMPIEPFSIGIYYAIESLFLPAVAV